MNEITTLIYDLFCQELNSTEIAQFLLQDSDFEGVDPLSIIQYIEETLQNLKEEWEADMVDNEYYI
jgi:hypothetical protein